MAAGDALDAAAARLEAAVERLARAASSAAARPAPRDPAAEAEIADLGRRLDDTVARLRLALGDDDAAPDDDAADAGEPSLASAAPRRRDA